MYAFSNSQSASIIEHLCISSSLMGAREQRLKRPMSPSGIVQGGKLVSNELPQVL